MRTIDTEKLPDELSRRRVLQGTAAGAALSLAGCLSPFGRDGSGSTDPVRERVDVDPDDIQTGGTFRVSLGEPVDSFDVPFSSSATASNLHGLLYEGMVRVDSTGEIYPWLAESYERLGLQEVGPADYEPYMTTAEYDSDGVPRTENRVLVEHPDNDPTTGEGLFLTTADAATAAADGTYGMHYRFRLHDGVTFHDGEEMTADNVVKSYERVGMAGSFLAPQLYDSLLHIEVVDEYTVDLYAQVPDAAAVRNLGGFDVYPTAVTDLGPNMNDPSEGNTPLGTGPFELSEYRPGEYSVFTSFDDYWFDTELKDWYDGPANFPNGPVVDEVDVSIVPDPSTRAGALENGEIDMTHALNARALDNFRDDESFRTARTAGAGFTFIQYPVTVEPWDDPRIRRAVNHLIPRTDISEQIFLGWENPAWIPLPPPTAAIATDDYEATVEEYRSYNTYDVDRARRLADEVVDERDVETPIEVTIRTNSNNDDGMSTVQLISEAMNRLDHFQVDIDPAPDLRTLASQIYAPDFHEQGDLLFVGLSSGFDPHGYIKPLHSPENFGACCNVQNIRSEELDRQLENARYGTDVVDDPSLRADRYTELMETVLELNANSYVTHSTTVGVVTDEVKGFNSYPSVQSLLPYGLYSPMEQQVSYLVRG